MLPSTRNVIGVIDIELNREELRDWLDDFEGRPHEPTSLQRDDKPVMSTVIHADLGRLSADLRRELASMLHQLRDTR